MAVSGKRRKEVRRRKKKIAAALMGTVIGVLLLVLAGLNVSGFLKLSTEVGKIGTMSQADGRIDMEIHAAGEFGEAERLIKQYMNEYLQALDETAGILNDEAYTGILTEANLQSDAPAFSESRACLAAKKTACQEGYAKLESMVAEETVQRLVEESGMGAVCRRTCAYYMERLREGFMYSAEEFAEACAETESRLEQKEAVLDFLSANSGYWHCSGGSLVFDIPQLTEQYNALTSAPARQESEEPGTDGAAGAAQVSAGGE